MKTISELEQEIRDFVTSPRKRAIVERDLADWGKLVSSLDVIGDTEKHLILTLIRKNQETLVKNTY